MILINQAKIYLRLIKNYQKIAKYKSFYFYIFTLPIFGYALFLFGKIILKINLPHLIIFFFEKKIFLSSIRFYTIEDLKKVSKILPKYNQILITKENFTINNLKKTDIIQSIKELGYAPLGKIFKDDDCKNFIKNLENMSCYNSQTPMQSDGTQIKFNSNEIKKNISNSSYYCFDSNLIFSFEPLKAFLKQKELNNLIDEYLNFKGSIYSSVTWFNPPSNEKHYVHRVHRDHDDFKFLGLIIYWTDAFPNSGATRIIEGSHNQTNQLKEVFLTGEAGTVYLVDFSSLHSGTKIENSSRVTTHLRYGKKLNHCTIIEGFSTTPQMII